MANKLKLIMQVRNLLCYNNNKTFIRDYRDTTFDYKVDKNKLYCYSEVFCQWIPDNLESWTVDELKILIKRLGGG